MGIRSKAITTHTLNFEFLTKQKFKRSSNIMKLVVVLLLVGIVTVSCLPKRGGGGKGKRNKPKPCEENDGVDWDEGCVCQDESTCDSKADCRRNCGFKSGNPILSCTCSDGEEWTKPEKPDKPETPCDGGRRWMKDVKSCTCDGETYEGNDKNEKKEMKRNCGRKGENAEECTCSDDSTWTPSEEDGEED